MGVDNERKSRTTIRTSHILHVGLSSLFEVTGSKSLPSALETHTAFAPHRVCTTPFVVHQTASAERRGMLSTTSRVRTERKARSTTIHTLRRKTRKLSHNGFGRSSRFRLTAPPAHHATRPRDTSTLRLRLTLLNFCCVDKASPTRPRASCFCFLRKPQDCAVAFHPSSLTRYETDTVISSLGSPWRTFGVKLRSGTLFSRSDFPKLGVKTKAISPK